MSNPIDIIIPTFNNQPYLSSCVVSILKNASSQGLFHVYIVNNGHPDSCNYIQSPYVTIINTGENLGWEGGLKAGLRMSKAPYLLFLNDDTYIPFSSRMWLNQLIQHFRDPKVGAVGPASNVVMGLQNIFVDIPFHTLTPTYLIGFCFMVRRSALDEVGGVDDTLPGGDDLDLSIRLRKGGYTLVADRNVFVYHHGFKTGERVHGTPDRPNGWNSYEFKEKTDLALIKKHGFREWWNTLMGCYSIPHPENMPGLDDIEGDIIREKIVGDVVLDLGCGGNKTIPGAIGVDLIQKDNFVETLKSGTKSSADINADVSKPLPIDSDSVDTIVARHILEHLLDTVQTLKQWKKVLKPGGRLIIAVPDQTLISSIPMNIEHVHGFTAESLKTALEVSGFDVVEQIPSNNHVSFVTVAEKWQ